MCPAHPTRSDAFMPAHATHLLALPRLTNKQTPSINFTISHLNMSFELELLKEQKRIAHLLEDISKISEELRKKEALLAGFMDVAVGQSRRLSSICATQDTMPWDTFTDPRDVPCSFPRSSSTDIAVCVWKRTGDRDHPPCLSLSNRFEPLANSPVPPATLLVVANAVPKPQVNKPGAADDPSQQRTTSCHKMLRNAVIMRSSGSTHPAPAKADDGDPSRSDPVVVRSDVSPGSAGDSSGLGPGYQRSA